MDTREEQGDCRVSTPRYKKLKEEAFEGLIKTGIWILASILACILLVPIMPFFTIVGILLIFVVLGKQIFQSGN